MRLSFPHGEHRDVLVGNGETTIGADASNTVVLAQPGVRSRHASIMVDPRGYTLRVHGADARVHVNARPVREFAILRLGDVVSIDAVSFVLKPDSDEAVTAHGVPGSDDPAAAEAEPVPATDAETRARVAPPKAVLRGVSGPYFGKVVPIHGRLTIGRDSSCSLVLDEPEMSRRHAAIEVTTSEIYLRDLGSANGTFVNGVQVRDTCLYSGDQIAFDRNRFLLEAPGMPTRRDAAAGARADEAPRAHVTAVMSAVRIDEAPRTDGSGIPSSESPGWSAWWLIAAAALVGIGIALLFFGLR